MSFPLSTCYHEAGHAVVMDGLGFPSRGAVVSSSGGGEARWGKIPGGEDAMAVYYAGPIASLLYNPAAHPGWGGDIPLSRGFLRKIEGSHDAAVRSACNRARQILDANWGAVEAVAAELQATGTVSGDRIKELIRAAAKRKPPTGEDSQQHGAGSLIQDTGKLTIGGRATVYKRQTWDHATRGIAFYFQPFAFRDFLRTQPDIAVQAFHNDETLVARTKNGTASFTDSEDGVSFEARLIDTFDGRALYEKIKTGLMGETSIGLTFSNNPDDVDIEMMNEVPTVNVKRGSFSELSIVPTGAMRGTSVSTRTLSAKSGQTVGTGKTLIEVERELRRLAIGTPSETLTVAQVERELRLLKAGITPPRLLNISR